MKRIIACFAMLVSVMALLGSCGKQEGPPKGTGTEQYRWYGDTYPIAIQFTDQGFFALISKDGETAHALGYGADPSSMTEVHTFSDNATVSSFHASGSVAVWCERTDGALSYYAFDALKNETITVCEQTYAYIGRIFAYRDEVYYLTKDKEIQTTHIMRMQLQSGVTKSMYGCNSDYIYDIGMQSGHLLGCYETALVLIPYENPIALLTASCHTDFSSCDRISLYYKNQDERHTFTVASTGTNWETGIRIVRMEQGGGEDLILTELRENETVPDGMLFVDSSRTIWVTKEVSADWMAHKMTVYDMESGQRMLYPNAIAFTVYENNLYYLARERGQTNDSTVLYLANDA